MLSLQLETYSSPAAVYACPFAETETNICLASLSAMVIGPGCRQGYCFNDNYDDCPIFLAKSLRKRR